MMPYLGIRWVDAVFSVLLAMTIMHQQLPGTGACQILVPAELLNGCTFESLTLTVPSSSFIVDRESCNDVVDKETFFEQPYVYFSGAIDVRTKTYSTEAYRTYIFFWRKHFFFFAPCVPG